MTVVGISGGDELSLEPPVASTSFSMGSVEGERVNDFGCDCVYVQHFGEK